MNELLNKNSTNFSPHSIVDFSDILDQLLNSVSVNRFVSQISVYHPASSRLISTHYGVKELTGETAGMACRSRPEERNGDFLRDVGIPSGGGHHFWPDDEYGQRLLDSCDGPVQQRAAVESAGGIF